MKTTLALALASLCSLLSLANAAEQTADLKDLSVSGGMENGKARLTIEAWLNGLGKEPEKGAFATLAQETVRVDPNWMAQTIALTVDVVAGAPQEFAFHLNGQGEIRQVSGDELQDWSIRREDKDRRSLVLRIKKPAKTSSKLSFVISAERELVHLPQTLNLLALTPPDPALLSGYLKIDFAPEINIQPGAAEGLVPLAAKYLPENMRTKAGPGEAEPLAFRFQGTGYTMPVRIELADPEAREVVLRDFRLQGKFQNQTASFTLETRAVVKNPKGGRLDLLSGDAALTQFDQTPGCRLAFNDGKYQLICAAAGEFPIRLRFDARVRQVTEGARGWSSVDFRVAPAVLEPLQLTGLAADTEFNFPGAARPEFAGETFKTFLPADGTVKLSWKEARPESEGKLFFATAMLSQINVAPGLIRQLASLDFKVMQGELNRVVLTLHGSGEVTRVSGADVLAWNVEPARDSPDRRLVVQLNQAQKDRFTLQVQLQTPLGAFPQTADAVRLRPEGATRFSGYIRVANEGAVRLEVAQTTGLSQISPEKFPESDLTRAFLSPAGNQRFAYRFSGAEYALHLQADQIQPEISVSELLAYRVAENELSIDGELELDIREAPVRELLLRVPKSFAVASLTAGALNDYFLREPQNEADAELRLLFGQPVTGRQVVQFRLERNQALAETNWALPRIEVLKAKSVRGHVAVAADPGLRVSPERTQGLTEIATAFFPGKVTGIQTAFRLNEPAWAANLRIERLPQTVQVEGFHLFSIGEGIAYGSSVLNFSISGAPVSTFRVELSDEYYNVEFTGKDIRNWQKTGNGFLVQLHSPVSGAYTLLATYERPFKAQNETLTFTGARPLGTQSDQGYTVVISAYQFEVKPVEISPGLLPLETREVPPEYRLFFDAPVLAAYKYNLRPFNLKLGLAPLAQSESLSLVIDRAALNTKISKEGQVVTEAQYFLKNRGNPHLRVKLPAGTELWSTAINGTTVVPVLDQDQNLIPLPQAQDPNAVMRLDLKLASRSADPGRVQVAAPILGSPVMLADWKLVPDSGRRLVFRSGSLTPLGGLIDRSGFAQLTRTLTGGQSGQAVLWLSGALVFMVLGALLLRWATDKQTYRFSARYWLGAVTGIAAWLVAAALFIGLISLVQDHHADYPREISFLAPVQQAGSALTVSVANEAAAPAVSSILRYCWPLPLALALWFYGWISESPFNKALASICGWTLLAWVSLRIPNGAALFIGVLALFFLIKVVIPSARTLRSVPKRPEPASSTAAMETGASAAVTALMLGGLLSLAFAANTSAAEPPNIESQLAEREQNLPEFVTQDVTVEDQYAQAHAQLRWQAKTGEVLPLLFEPAVLTSINFPTNALKLLQVSRDSRRIHELVAMADGLQEVELTYTLRVVKGDSETSFALPLPPGLMNDLKLTLLNLDVNVLSQQAVSINCERSESNTVARLILPPVDGARISWKPRSRDVQSEKAIFYAELSQLYVPTAGVIEGIHLVSIRPAQGEIGELVFKVPEGATITDVGAPSLPAPPAGAEAKPAPPLVSLWRFDPDTRKLRVTLNPPQSRPFTILVRSQVPSGTLPFEQSVGLLSVEQSASQIGLVGLGTGQEVQLDNVTASELSPINLEDFPPDAAALLQAQIPGLTVRRAYRYAGVQGSVALSASAVQPDVRVESQDTVSLGEDRVVVAATANVEITRAGIFRLSFDMPLGYDVESITGQALSHWTEMKGDTGRLITLHFNGKTEGKQQFAISLAGPGVLATNDWVVPQVQFSEAGKQSGTLLLVPEQGLRLQVASAEGLTQLDPQKAGIKQKGVLAFRVLQSPRSLTVNLEQVNPWIQVTSLQHATVGEAQVKIAANLQYQIENTGVKGFRLLIPTNAESVRFQGEQVSDFLPVPGALTNDLQQWEVKLHRRVIGAYALQATWQSTLPEHSAAFTLRGIQALEVNLQRGFVTLQSAGRLQLRAEAPAASLQVADWQSIPRALQQALPRSSGSAHFTFRLIDPDFRLPLGFERHEAAKLLPARVNSIVFNSVISDEGVMLTQARLELVPGDERLLKLKLPAQARFWFAFVNQNGVWPWRQADEILVPLEKQSKPDAAIPVEIFYTCSVGQPGSKDLNLQLLAPKFELPLENITWQVSLSDKWKIRKWSGSLQLQQDQVLPVTGDSLQAYLQTETSAQQQRTKQAEQFLAAANSALQQGEPQQARREFQAAYGLSTHDAAFNEDARVQLHNIKLQQALIGLNVRQSAAGGEPGGAAARLRELRSGKDLNYTQQDAKEIIERNSDEENAALMRLAERLIQQQDAAVTAPAALRANIPQQGQLLTFSRAVAVDRWADLHLQLKASAASAASWGMRLLLLIGTFALLAVFAVLLKPQSNRA